MTNLSHTQEYYLCAVSPKGSAPSETVTACLIISGVAEILRSEFLENGELTEDTVILAALLDKSGLLGSYFNKTETVAFKARMKEVRSSETYAAINKVLTAIDDDTAAIFTAVILPIITGD
jgi:hypothetical protein